ncbi:MAG: diacylglycerol O-acyltransferase / wax synthase [Actinomycetota bacterium]|jgi:diacylglycerol O-acyltransferase|nr:diacylglycerol O-acyltransferase / wax synthase [Actinomycetota bacterium]
MGCWTLREVSLLVADRLSPLDVSFLYFEEATTPMHVGGVAVFQAPADGFDYERLLHLIKERIPFVPRYRQRIRWVPGRLANPVWVDDEHFDIAYHVRRAVLPKPGNDDQLHEFVARVQSRQLDRDRPLWEMYLVEGLSKKRFAVITKTHHAMVDGLGAVDIAQVILDTTRDVDDMAPPGASTDSAAGWHPAPEPSWVELMAGAVADNVRRPSAVVDAVRAGLTDVRSTAGRVAGAAGGLLAAGLTAARPAPVSPLNVPIGEHRRYATVDSDLDDYRRIRKAHGGTVNDVVLACVAGALRAWLLTRGENVTPYSTVRVMVPVSVRGSEEKGVPGNRVASYLVDLPVGEPSPVMRLHQVSYRMKAHKETGQAVGAEALAGLAGFAPPTMHALGARVASSMSKRWFNLVVTNVPGPQQPLYAGGARMLAAYPVVPLAKAQAVSIGLTSYDGGVYYGLNADREAMPDVEVLAACITDALAELLATVR